MEVVFRLFIISKIVFGYSKEDLQMLESKFCSFRGYVAVAGGNSGQIGR
jgi:hypothetical protein